jgi:hypothetical protein
MLEMCRALGFETSRDPEDRLIYKVRLSLPASLKKVASVTAEPA